MTENHVIDTLEKALERIKTLEDENERLKEELEIYRKRQKCGRKKHNAAWKASYNDFACKYESGMTVMEIVKVGDISRRTAYRYKAYYDETHKNISKTKSLLDE